MGPVCKNGHQRWRQKCHNGGDQIIGWTISKLQRPRLFHGCPPRVHCTGAPGLTHPKRWRLMEQTGVRIKPGETLLLDQLHHGGDNPVVVMGKNGCVPPFTHGVSTRPVRLMKPGVIRAVPDVRFHASSEPPCR